MTSLGFPFTVDHDTDYVGFAGNVGGVPQNWHVEYCRGEAQPKSPADLKYEKGWHAEYWFFRDPATQDGFDISSKPANYKTVDAAINFPNDRSWIGGKHPNNFPRDKYQAKWTGLLRITRPGEYTFATASDDGSKLWIDENL